MISGQSQRLGVEIWDGLYSEPLLGQPVVGLEVVLDIQNQLDPRSAWLELEPLLREFPRMMRSIVSFVASGRATSYRTHRWSNITFVNRSSSSGTRGRCNTSHPGGVGSMEEEAAPIPNVSVVESTNHVPQNKKHN
jgi:hypothetical protein